MVFCRCRDLYLVVFYQFQNACLELGTIVYVELFRIFQRSFFVNVLEHLRDFAGFFRFQRPTWFIPRGYVNYV